MLEIKKYKIIKHVIGIKLNVKLTTLNYNNMRLKNYIEKFNTHILFSGHFYEICLFLCRCMMLPGRSLMLLSMIVSRLSSVIEHECLYYPRVYLI